MVISSSLGFLGFTKQTGFKASIYLSQISEFSIILAVLAHTTGLVSSHVVSVITLTAMITIAVSSVLMNYDDKLYLKLQNVLSMYERPNARSERTKSETYKLVLFGYRKGGYEFVKTFREMRKRYVVIDYDPDVIEHLERQHIHHIYGDATDYELLQEIGVHNADMVVSTIPDYATNAILVRHVMQWNSDGIFICHANDLDDAAKLYEHGAAYVILPHFIGNEQINSFIRKNGNNLQAFQQYRSRHILALGKAAVR